MSPSDHPRLFIPGPTEVSPAVLATMTRPMIGHRGKDFEALFARIGPKLQSVFRTHHPVLTATASATAIMEAAVRNTVRARCLCLVNGAFSDRWHQICVANGIAADRLDWDWGRAVRPGPVADRLKSGRYDAVTVVHNETSTGVTSPLAEIAEVVASQSDVLLLVDTVSSLGGSRVDVGAWRIDVCLAGSQKALALPPGLTFFSVSDRALERATTCERRGFAFDFVQYHEFWKKNVVPTTPAVSLLYATDFQLDRILAEGLEARMARHREMAETTRAWARARFELYAEEGFSSDTLTAIRNSRSIDVPSLNRELRKRGAEIGTGYGKIQAQTFRIAHMGDIQPAEIRQLLEWIDDIIGATGR
ncbi:MAG: alanine--glyoxylate aminotransferase family protein [Planctomycetes bacterium]|nr:alanine--glyoxylate aminotransferase family protein [Planctomycetota bacterium]